MMPKEWLRAVAVWSPFPEVEYDLAHNEADVVEALAEMLFLFWPPEAFSEETVKLVAKQCETFPNYYWINKVLEGAGFHDREAQP